MLKGTMSSDTQLQTVNLAAALEKRRLDQALNAKEFAEALFESR